MLSRSSPISTRYLTGRLYGASAARLQWRKQQHRSMVMASTATAANTRSTRSSRSSGKELGLEPTAATYSIRSWAITWACGWQPERILERLQQYPDGIGSRYIRE